jgi:hypothetical protein
MSAVNLDDFNAAYRAGESNREADYSAAFNEWPDLHLIPDVTAFADKVRREARATDQARIAELTHFRDETERQYQRAVEQISVEWSRAEAAEATVDRVRALADEAANARNFDGVAPWVYVPDLRAALSGEDA